MSLVLHCQSTTCPDHLILGVILDDGSLRQLVRGRKVHVHSGCVVVGCMKCGYEQQLVLPYPLPTAPSLVR